MYLRIIRFWGNKLEKFLSLQVGQTRSWLEKKNSILLLKAGQVQVLHNTYTIQSMEIEGDEGTKRGVKSLHKNCMNFLRLV